MADNQILISAAFDLGELDRQMKRFTTAFRRGLNDSLKNLKIDISKLQGLKDLRIPLKVELTQAKKDIDEFRKQLKNNPLMIGTVVSAPTAKASGKETSSPDPLLGGLPPNPRELLNQNIIDAATRALRNFQRELAAGGATQKEITKATKDYETQLAQLQKRLEAIDRARAIRGREQNLPHNALAAPTEKELFRYKDGKLQIDALTKSIQNLDKAQIQSSISTERATHFMESFGFKIGILGFGMGIFAGHLQRLSQAMFQFVQDSAKATESLERVTNLITQMEQQGQIAPGQGPIILQELNRLADLPGSNLERVVKSFRSLANLNIGLQRSLQLIEGLTKATALAGTGAEGIERLTEQLRQFVTSGVITERDIRTISEQGGIKVTEALQAAFGSTSPKRLEEVGPEAVIDAIIKGLQSIQTPLRTTSDFLNIINNAWIRMQANINVLIVPGLEKIVGLLAVFEGYITSIRVQFEQLSPTTKSFLSGLLVSLPIIATALAGILTVLSAVAIALATMSHIVPAVSLAWGALGRQVELASVHLFNFNTRFKEIAASLLNLPKILSSSAASVSNFIKGLGASLINFTKGLGASVTFLQIAINSLRSGSGVFKDALKAAALAPFIRGLGALTFSLSSVSGALSGVGVGLFRILGLTNPIGLAINAIVAFITNWGDFRSNIVSGAADIVKGIGDVIKALNTFSDTKIGGALVVILQAIFDLLEGIIRVAGAAIGAILSLVGSVLTFAADLINVFNADTWSKMFQRILDAVSTFGLRMAQAFAKVILSISRGLVQVVGGIMEKMGILRKGFVAENIKAIDDFTKAIADNNLKFVDGKLVIDNYNAAQVALQDTLSDTTQELRNQEIAFNALAESAERSRKASQRQAAAGAASLVSEEMQAIRNEISTLQADFKAGLDKAFSPSEVEARLKAVTAKILEKQKEYIRLGNQLINANIQQGATGIDEDLLKDAGKSVSAVSKNRATPDKFLGDLTVLQQSIIDFSNPKDYARFKEAVDLYEQALNRILNPEARDTENTFLLFSDAEGRDLRQVLESARGTLNKITGDAKKEANNFNKFTNDQIRSINEAAETRALALKKEKENLRARGIIQQQESEIEAERAKIRENESRVEKFLLTAAEARRRNTQIELEIARLERNKERAKLERDKANTENPNEKAQIDLEIEKLEQEHINKLDTIRKKGQAEQDADDRRATEARLKRFKSAGDDLLKVIKPFEERIINAFSLAFLSEDNTRTRQVFKDLAADLRLVGGSLGDINDIAQKFESGDGIGKLLSNFLDLTKIPLERDLNVKLLDLRNKFQALVLSALATTDGKIDSVGGVSPALADALGIVAGGTIDSVIENIQKLDVAKISKLITATGITNATNEVEDLLQILSEALNIQAEIKNIDLNARRELIGKVIDRLSQVQLGALETQISETEAKIAESERKVQETGIDNEVAFRRELLAVLINYQTQREVLERKYAAVRELNETQDAERRKEIERQLQADLLTIISKGQAEITKLTGQPATIGAANLPASLPGADSTTTPQTSVTQQPKGIFDILRAARGVTENEKFSTSINKISEAFDGYVKAGLAAANASKQFIDSLTSGDLIIATFQNMLDGTASSMDLFGSVAISVAGAIANAFTSALQEAIQSGENFFAAFARLLGQHLINMGLALLAQLAAAYAFALIEGLIFQDWSLLARVVAITPYVAAAAGALIGLGALLGGAGGAAQAAGSNTTNKANAQTGARGDDFDPNKDPRAIFQKALMAQIEIDIKTDDTQIVKTVIKHVNQNSRLTKLIGNRKLNFGY